MIVLDFGSGNTCKNDINYIRRMIDELALVDLDRECIIKWQLFKEAGDNIPLKQYMFAEAYRYAAELGFYTTASIFDLASLNFLLSFIIPFVKIANNTDMYWLAGRVPRSIPVMVSCDEENKKEWDKYAFKENIIMIQCISKYPALLRDYEKAFSMGFLEEHSKGISDHTSDWALYKKYNPIIYECHFKLEDSTGLDSGDFARTPQQLRSILNG